MLSPFVVDPAVVASKEAAWGTWEELLLGSAVLRHGDAAWDAVADELRSRTPLPHLFSPQACEAKFEELQERYSGCESAWFEELRKKRVLELKRELERSENSIGFLQAKLKNLSSQRESRSNSTCHTSQTESPSSKVKVCANDPFGEDTSKDGSSAASFAQKTGRDCCSTSHFVDSVSNRDNELKMDISVDSEKMGGLIGDLACGFASFKKKRSERKRRACTIVKEGTMEESEIMISPTCMDAKEILDARKLDALRKSYRPASGETSNMDLRRIMDFIMDDKDISSFQHKLENQKKAKYRKLIRQHVDFRTIKSRIGDGSISSSRELFRDLFLLSNNALVFYSKKSIEHKSALNLLEHVKKIMRENTESSACRSGEDDVAAEPIAIGKPKKGGSVQPCNHSTKRKPVVADKEAITSNTVTGRKASRARVPVESPTKKRAIGRPVKSGQRGGRRQKESPNDGKKRARRS